MKNPHQVRSAYQDPPAGAMPLEARTAVAMAFLRLLERRYPGTVWTIEEYEQAAA